MPPLDGTPPLPQVPLDPLDDLAPQPGDILRGVVAAGVLALGVCPPARVYDMDEGVGVAQIVQELISEALALMGAGDQTGDIKEFDRYGPATF